MRLVSTCGSKILVLFFFFWDFDIDIFTGVYFFIHFLLFDDVIGHVRDFELHVLGSFHWSVKIEVADANGHEFGSFGQDGAVE